MSSVALANQGAAATIVPIDKTHRENWRELYRAQGAVHDLKITDDALVSSWEWLFDPKHPLEGLVALDDDRSVVGLAHFRSNPVPQIGRHAGYLEDLFVDPNHRGKGVGRALIAAVAEIAWARGWPFVRWITAPDNDAAVALYQQIATRRRWVTYDLIPPDEKTEVPSKTSDKEE